MTDVDHLDDDDQGDGPDTFDGRLSAVRRLIDTFGDEQTDEHRRLRRAVIVLGLGELVARAGALIAAELDRAADL